MMTIATSASRPIVIIRVCATGRVPFGFTPVTAANTATTTARLSHTNQFMVELFYKTQASVQQARFVHINYCSLGSLVRNMEITRSETRIVMTVMSALNRR
jgi:hypothetical protein